MERAERLYVLQAPWAGLTASSRTRRVALGRRGLHQIVRFARTLTGSVGLQPLSSICSLFFHIPSPTTTYTTHHHRDGTHKLADHTLTLRVRLKIEQFLDVPVAPPRHLWIARNGGAPVLQSARQRELRLTTEQATPVERLIASPRALGAPTLAGNGPDSTGSSQRSLGAVSLTGCRTFMKHTVDCLRSRLDRTHIE